jgi:TPR repeat protein
VRLIAATAAALWFLGTAGAGIAQDTSSWSSTVTPPSKRSGGAQIQRNDGQKVPARPIDSSPDASPVSKLRPTMSQPRASTHDKTTGPPGENAAFEAFEQGRYLTALELAQKAAEKGDASAHTLIGRLHQDGLGIPQDAVLAAQWYRRGAELGDREAMFAYGVILADGLGVKRDRAGAGQMFEAAAQRGHVVANYNLALLFLHGDGKPENPYRALAHMRYAAENNLAVAQYDLATMYATGQGLPGEQADALEAARWMSKAAEAGYAEAELEYATMLFRGMGLEADHEKAPVLIRNAAEKGLAIAQNRLARVLVHGLGTERNAVEAATWHLMAKSAGVGDPDLDAAVAKLSRADRTKAESAAAAKRDRQMLQ